MSTVCANNNSPAEERDKKAYYEIDEHWTHAPCRRHKNFDHGVECHQNIVEHLGDIILHI